TKFDEDLGAFREELKAIQLEENTIFIYMSDNGPGPWFGGIKIDMEEGFVEEGYNAGMRGAKIWGYEGAHRVPFFIRWPAKGIGGGRDVDELTAHFDILPTLLELTNIDTPDSVNLDGMSFEPLLTDEAGADWPARTIFVHNQREEFLVKYKDYQVLTETWRLIGTREEKELYNITVDSGQVNDIASENPVLVDQLTEEYETWWADISTNSGEYHDIEIGSEHDTNPVLYAHDAHRLDQNKLLWAIDVKKAGMYEFNIYRWPIESDLEITYEESNDEEDVSTIENAHLIIGNISHEKIINNSMKSATFTVGLKEGETSLISWFSGNGNVRSNYIQVQRIGPAVTEPAEPYEPVSPGDFLK
ncbi:MAG: sulfatase-like hydrolase/transferase, partial [Balneolaceae bacterium]|nr:sulfatase-like hydrolase/transferase [Balneolaceae bacterium]